MPDQSAESSSPAQPSTAPGAHRKPRRWPWLLLVLLILAAGFVGFGALHKFKPTPQVKPLVRQSPFVDTVSPLVRRGGLPVIGNGLVRPRTQVTLAAEISARIVAVHPGLVTGGTISKDDVLISVDPAPFKAALSQAAADRRSAQAANSLAKQLVTRTQNLIKQGFLSRQTLDERVASRDQAAAALQRARAVYTQRKIDLSRTQIIAPFNGRVLSKAVNTGDTVQPGRELAVVFDDTALEVAVSLTSNDMALIDNAWGAQSNRTPALATVRVDHGGSQYQWPARVERVEAAIDSATRTFNVVVRALKPKAPGKPMQANLPDGPPLVVGMYAQVEITGRDQGTYAMLPRNALRENDQIWLIDENSKINIVSVRVLTELDDQVAIAIDGLSEKSQVVITDLRVVTQGMPVRVSGNGPAQQSASPANKS